jgi:hypothetical protein
MQTIIETKNEQREPVNLCYTGADTGPDIEEKTYAISWFLAKIIPVPISPKKPISPKVPISPKMSNTDEFFSDFYF